ncbi:MAG: hypothetical protein OEV08_06185 [Nitrospira sp.]|nr:hypothetical protein [Nitrospira sp.]
MADFLIRRMSLQNCSLGQYLASEIVRAVLLLIIFWFVGHVLVRGWQPAIQPAPDMFWG